MSAYDQMSPRQFAQTMSNKRHEPVVNPDELAQKRFDNPDYEPSEPERAYLQGVETGSQQEQETAKAEKEYNKVKRESRTATPGKGTSADPAVSTLKPKPASRRQPKAPPDPAKQAYRAAKAFSSLARKASGRRR